MSTAQGWVLAALLLTAYLNIAASTAAYDLLKQGDPVGASKALSPHFGITWVIAVVALVIVADAAPQAAGWIAGLILLGAVLTKGPQALGATKA